MLQSESSYSVFRREHFAGLVLLLGLHTHRTVLREQSESGRDGAEAQCAEADGEEAWAVSPVGNQPLTYFALFPLVDCIDQGEKKYGGHSSHFGIATCSEESDILPH